MSELTKISERNKRKLGDYLKSTWYFETVWEKAILIGLNLCGLIRIVQWLV